jgi:hypothetical protein
MSSDALARVVNQSAHPAFVSRPKGQSRSGFLDGFSINCHEIVETVAGATGQHAIIDSAKDIPGFRKAICQATENLA